MYPRHESTPKAISRNNMRTMDADFHYIAPLRVSVNGLTIHAAILLDPGVVPEPDNSAKVPYSLVASFAARISFATVTLCSRV